MNSIMNWYRNHRKLFWVSLIAVPLVFLCFSVFVIGDGFIVDTYATSAKASLQAMQPTIPDQPAQGAVANEVNVWIETSPSMYGFWIKSGDHRYYQNLLAQLPRDLKTNTPIDTLNYHVFRGSTCKQVGVQSATLAINEYTYTSAEEGSALLCALNELDLSKPSIIFTDMEDSSDVYASLFTLGQTDDGNTTTALRQACSKIMQSNKTIVVLGFRTAFSGGLFDYGNAATVYSYGSANKPSNCTADSWSKNVIGGSKKYNRKPRNFYTMVVGSAEECSQIKDTLLASYDSLVRPDLNTNKKNTYEVNGLPYNRNGFIGSAWITFGQNRVLQTLYKTSGIANGSGIEIDTAALQNAQRSEAQPFSSLGIYEYTGLRADAGDGNMVIPITVLPAMEDYASSYATDDYRFSWLDETTGQRSNGMQIAQLNRTHVQVSEDRADDWDDILIGRGLHGTQLSLGDFTGASSWFTLSGISADLSGLHFSLSVDLLNCAPGLYRVCLPLEGKHTREEAVDPLPDWVQNWSQSNLGEKASFTSSEAPFVPQYTLGLEEQLGEMKAAQGELVDQTYLKIAYITIDLRIE